MSDPIIAGIFAKMPPVETRWVAADRLTWLQTMEMAFRLVYTRRPDEPDMAIAITLAGEPEQSPFAWSTLPNTWGTP
jgi:hypothetical protein